MASRPPSKQQEPEGTQEEAINSGRRKGDRKFAGESEPVHLGWLTYAARGDRPGWWKKRHEEVVRQKQPEKGIVEKHRSGFHGGNDRLDTKHDMNGSTRDQRREVRRSWTFHGYWTWFDSGSKRAFGEVR